MSAANESDVHEFITLLGFEQLRNADGNKYLVGAAGELARRVVKIPLKKGF